MAKAHQINPERARWLEVLGVSMPLCLSYLPIGIACGILLNAAGMNFVLTFLVSIMVFSGGPSLPWRPYWSVMRRSPRFL
ncbi:hypothetical protein LFLT20_01070 [Limosilactobacillus fermentum]|nr:hypothetical protein LFLT20_01070 [Limosilactobacillus fermentum]